MHPDFFQQIFFQFFFSFLFFLLFLLVYFFMDFFLGKTFQNFLRFFFLLTVNHFTDPDFIPVYFLTLFLWIRIFYNFYFTFSNLQKHFLLLTPFFAIFSALNFFLHGMNDYVFQLWYYSPDDYYFWKTTLQLLMIRRLNLWSICFWKVYEAIQLHFEVVSKNFVQLFVSVLELLVLHCHSQKRSKKRNCQFWSFFVKEKRDFQFFFPQKIQQRIQAANFLFG